MKTEEEQIAAIKQWWKNNGSSLAIGIVAALVIVFGWQAWQSHQAEQRSAASNEYQQLLVAVNESDSDESEKTIAYIAGKLQDKYGSSPYAIYATLILADQQFSEKNDPEAAVKSLNWVQSKVDNGPLLLLVKERMARAQFAAGHPDDALETLGNIEDAGSYTALFAELQGDILSDQGNIKDAKNAYRMARKASVDDRNPILELKMSDLAIGEDA